MNTKLTKDADALICVLYEAYLKSVESGTPKSKARLLGNSKYIQQEFLPKWTHDTVIQACGELERADCLVCNSADGYVVNTFLSDTGIIYMENRFKNGLSELCEYMGKILNILRI